MARQGRRPLLFRPGAPTCASGSGACSSCASARPHARAHNIEQIVRLGTTAATRCSSCAATPASATTSARKASCTSTRRKRVRRRASTPAEQMRALGCERRVISADEAVKLEPALAYPAATGRAPPTRPRTNRATPTASRASSRGCGRGRREVPDEPHHHRAAARRAADRPRRGHRATAEAASSASAAMPS